MSPFGGAVERVSGDAFRLDENEDARYQHYGYLPTDGVMGVGLGGSMTSDSWCDGRYIWFFQPDQFQEIAIDPSETNRQTISRIDTETLMFEEMWTGTFTQGPGIDSHELSSARIGDWSWITGDDNWIYWFEPYESFAQSSFWVRESVQYLRRMSLTPPHRVETVDNGWRTPTGLEVNAATDTWAKGRNRQTDLVLGRRIIGGFNGCAIHKGYIYFISWPFRADGQQVTQVNRWKLDSAEPIEFLYEADTTGSWIGPIGGPNGYGTADALPFKVFHNIVIVGDYLVFLSETQFFEYNLFAFHIPTLVDAAKDGPVIHDPYNPMFKWITDGTSLTDQGRHDWNVRVDERHYAWRDGSQPLTNSPIPGAITAGRGPFEGRLVFLDAAPLEHIWDAQPKISRGGHAMVKMLEPPEEVPPSSWDVTVVFEGTTMKGYGNRHAVEPRTVLDRVILQ
jgi:hypothetical protein